jgi:hypothetical protein
MLRITQSGRIRGAKRVKLGRVAAASTEAGRGLERIHPKCRRESAERREDAESAAQAGRLCHRALRTDEQFGDFHGRERGAEAKLIAGDEEVPALVEGLAGAGG